MVLDYICGVSIYYFIYLLFGLFDVGGYYELFFDVIYMYLYFFYSLILMLKKKIKIKFFVG